MWPVKADIEHLFVEAKKAFGKIDILVNNAGVYDWSPIEESPRNNSTKL